MRIDQVVPVFHVSAVDQSVAFYRDVLGFREDFRFAHYVGMKLEGFSLHLSQSDGRGRPVGGGTVYVFCDDVDGYYARRIKGSAATIIQPPADQEYGMRDFVLHDPDGNQLSFGKDTGTGAA